MLNIKCPHYELITINNSIYYLSENISEKDEFLTFEQLDFSEKNLIDLANSISSVYPKQAKFLAEQLFKIYLFDILILNPDRKSSNIGMYFKNGKITDLYILDNECSFYKMKKVNYTLSSKKRIT